MPLGLGTTLKAAVLAALLAALVASAFHQLISEPLIDQAIQLEAARHPGQAEDELVSRPVQRVGLVLALALYGVTWALALGGVFALAQEHLPGGSPGRRAAALVATAGWGVALFPLLVEPANPPGVGDASTLQARQALYFAALVLGALGALAMLVGWRSLSRRRGGDRLARVPWALPLAGYALFCLLAWLLLPSNTDAAAVPPGLLLGFRLRSALGQLVFWGLFALAFGLLVERWSAATQGRSRAARAVPAVRPER